MLNYTAKYLLAFTAVSPTFGAAAILAVTNYNSWAWGAGLLIAGLISATISLLVIRFVKTNIPPTPLDIKELEMADQKVLEFMLAYLLPIYSMNNLNNLAGSMILSLYSLFVVSLVVVQGNIFQFNPILSLFGYHFYIGSTVDKIKYLIITKRVFHLGDRQLRLMRISDYIFLDAEGDK